MLVPLDNSAAPVDLANNQADQASTRLPKINKFVTDWPVTTLRSPSSSLETKNLFLENPVSFLQNSSNLVSESKLSTDKKRCGIKLRFGLRFLTQEPLRIEPLWI